MTTLKDAQASGDLSKFIAERKDQPPGSLTATEKAIESASKTSPTTPKPLRPGKRVG